MNTLLMVYIKNNLVLFVSCIALVAFNMLNIASFDFIAYILMAMLVFDMNVSDKVKGNWGLLETLPINLHQRFFIRVVIPFLFIVLVTIGVQEDFGLFFLLDDGIHGIFLSASTLIMASLMAKSLNRFLIYIAIVSLINANISLLPYGGLIATILFFLVSYYIISNYRVSQNKLGVIGISVLLPSLIVLHFAQAPVYKSLLVSKDKNISFFAASKLIEMDKNEQAINLLAETILKTRSVPEVKAALDILDDNNINVNFTKQQWLDLFSKYSLARHDIIDHFGNRKIQFDWLSHSGLYEFEEIILSYPKCRRVCKDLANLVRFDIQEVDKQRLKSLLSDARLTRNEYALRIIQSLDSTDYIKEAIALLSHPDEEISENAFEYLSDMTRDDLRHELRNIEKAIKENGSLENLERAKKLRD